MKKLYKAVFLLSFLCLSGSAFGQIVFPTDWKSEADKKVYVTDWKSEADMIVYKTDWKSEAKEDSGLWYTTDWKSEADWKIYYTDWKSEADIIVFFTDWKSEAGWKKKVDEAGIEIKHEETWGGGKRSFYFDDPDGHCVEIMGGDIWV